MESHQTLHFLGKNGCQVPAVLPDQRSSQCLCRYMHIQQPRIIIHVCISCALVATFIAAYSTLQASYPCSSNHRCSVWHLCKQWFPKTQNHNREGGIICYPKCRPNSARIHACVKGNISACAGFSCLRVAIQSKIRPWSG